MPKATISFVVGEGHTEIASISCNINVPVKLPSGEDAGYVFNGWFYDQEFTKAVPANLVITEDITLYAKYSNPAKLTIVYNDGVTEIQKLSILLVILQKLRNLNMLNIVLLVGILLKNVQQVLNGLVEHKSMLIQ